MGHLDEWKVVEEMITALRGKGIVIPSETMAELQSAKTLIHVLEADPSRADTSQEIDKCLFNVESYVASEGQIMFGIEYVNKWLTRLDQAKEALEEMKEEPKSLPNIPRGAKWIRINPSAQSIDSKKLADELHLSCITQSKGFLLVQGKDEQLREFVKKMAAKDQKTKLDEQTIHPF